ncbi:MAG: serine protease DegS [Gammaproteobacteria bacterium]|jgi:serine protease DegS
MKVLKTIGFITQFSLIGLLTALAFLIWSSDRSLIDLYGFVSGPNQHPLRSNHLHRESNVDSYADAVASSFASVVTIYTSKQVEAGHHPLFDDPVFSQFFGDQLKRRQQSNTETNLGSGVIIGNDGYIITNQHVIDSADEILISLSDGRGGQAILIGQDKETDIAILQIPMNSLSAIKTADDSDIRVGDVVLAIGNPLNVGQTVTMGIVSATGRNRVGLNTFENFIQTDAAINPGNSGGALINSRGELIGINTAIFSRGNGAEGIGFAIPASIALNIMQEIINHGKVLRGWLGVEGTEITAQAAMRSGNPNIRGALIVGVFIDSPADQAGIQSGDIMTAINSQSVNSVRDLLEKITDHKPGDVIQVEVLRQQKSMQFTLTATERD